MSRPSFSGRAPRVAAAIAAGIGLLALTGWVFDVTALKGVLPGLATMKANTAVGAVLGGASLWWAGDPRDGRRAMALSRIAAALVVLIGGLTLVEYLAGVDLGIDQLLFRDDPGDALTSHPGRMAPNTALGFLLVGTALLAWSSEPRPGWRPATWLALVVCALSLAALVGYLYSVTLLYRLASFTGMAVHTALALFVLGAGVLSGHPESPLVRMLDAPGPGGRLVRRLFPALVLVPLAIGWLRLRAEEAGLVGTETGVAAMVTSLILVLTLLLYLAAAEAERTDAARSAAEALFRTAVEASPNGMIMVDPGGRIVLVNEQTGAVLGYPSGELVGQAVEVLLPEPLRRLHERHRGSYLETPTARRMGEGRDLRARHRDGSEIPVEVGLSPVERPDGTYVLASLIDITRRKRTEDELRRSNEELERFAYVASHDLQEPLRMVASYVQLLEKRYRGRLDADADEFIGYAADGAQRARQLIQELLAYSRVGTHGRARVPVDADAALERALTSLQLAVEEAGASVTSGPLPTVLADASQLERVFLNLVSNALRFRSEAPPRVRIDAVRDGRQWVFSVTDNGIGIAPEYHDRIFVIFQRLHGRGEYPGTGMGLAITKKIVERHDGRIWVESVPGEGTTVFFTLPAYDEEVS